MTISMKSLHLQMQRSRCGNSVTIPSTARRRGGVTPQLRGDARSSRTTKNAAAYPGAVAGSSGKKILLTLYKTLRYRAVVACT